MGETHESRGPETAKEDSRKKGESMKASTSEIITSISQGQRGGRKGLGREGSSDRCGGQREISTKRRVKARGEERSKSEEVVLWYKKKRFTKNKNRVKSTSLKAKLVGRRARNQTKLAGLKNPKRPLKGIQGEAIQKGEPGRVGGKKGNLSQGQGIVEATQRNRERKQNYRNRTDS